MEAFDNDIEWALASTDSDKHVDDDIVLKDYKSDYSEIIESSSTQNKKHRLLNQGQESVELQPETEPELQVSVDIDDCFKDPDSVLKDYVSDDNFSDCSEIIESSSTQNKKHRLFNQDQECAELPVQHESEPELQDNATESIEPELQDSVDLVGCFKDHDFALKDKSDSADHFSDYSEIIESSSTQYKKHRLRNQGQECAELQPESEPELQDNAIESGEPELQDSVELDDCFKDPDSVLKNYVSDSDDNVSDCSEIIESSSTQNKKHRLFNQDQECAELPIQHESEPELQDNATESIEPELQDSVDLVGCFKDPECKKHRLRNQGQECAELQPESEPELQDNAIESGEPELQDSVELDDWFKDPDFVLNYYKSDYFSVYSEISESNSTKIKAHRLSNQDQECVELQPESSELELQDSVDLDDTLKDPDFVLNDYKSDSDDYFSDCSEIIESSSTQNKKHRLFNQDQECAELSVQHESEPELQDNATETGEPKLQDSVSENSQQNSKQYHITSSEVPSEHDHQACKENEIVRDKHVPGIFTRKTLHSDIGQKNKQKANNRIHNVHHCCFICHKLSTNIRKHLFTHRTNKEIKQLAEMKLYTMDPKQKSQSQKLQTRLRNRGDHLHNSCIIKQQYGELLVSRRSEKFNYNDYGPCPFCLEWIKINVSAYKHKSTCPIGDITTTTKKEIIIQSYVLMGKVSLSASDTLVKEVFTIMSSDDLTEIAQNDPLIIALGNYTLRQNITNKRKRKYYTSSKMRGVAKLLLYLREGKEDIPLNDFLVPSCFDSIADAALKCATVNADDDEELKSPSAAIKLGFDIARLANIKLAKAIKDNDIDCQKDAENLNKLLKLEWSNKVTKIARKILRERSMNRVYRGPDPDDLQKMSVFLKKALAELPLNVNETDQSSFKKVATYTQARLLLYNKRRSGELESMTLVNYKNRSIGMERADEALMGELTDVEKVLLGSQELISIQGKAENVVPVLVPPDASKPLAYLTDPSAREKGGVKETNPYVFGNSGREVFRAYESVKQVCLEASVNCPEKITSVTVRKYFATMTQVIGMKDHELQYLCKHLGHSVDVHKLHYRAASGYIERINIGKLMLIQDFNVASKFRGRAVEDISVEDIIKNQDSNERPDGLPEDDTVVFETEAAVSVDDSVSETGAKKKKTAPKKVWTEQEMEEINRFFAENISKKKCPSRKEILHAIKTSKAENGIIHMRNWEHIKKKVWNIYQKK